MTVIIATVIPMGIQAKKRNVMDIRSTNMTITQKYSQMKTSKTHLGKMTMALMIWRM